MKILWIPQISSKGADGKVLLESDSNFAFLMNLMDSAFGAYNDIDLALEFDPQIATLYLHNEITKKRFERVFIDYSHQFTNAMVERLHFNTDFYSCIGLDNYDIIFTNEPTKATALKLMLKGGSKTKIVSYNHWLALDNMKPLVLRQIEGIQNSDLVLVNSFYTIDRLDHYCSMKEIVIVPRMEVLPPSYNLANCKRVLKNSKITGIVYNHRLSSDPYYADAYRDLIEVLNLTEQVVGVENMPTVYFTNPSGKDFKLNEKPYFQLLNISSQKAYYAFLQSNSVQVHLNTFFKANGMWSMSTVESAVCGNACLVPNRAGYAEIFSQDYKGYHQSIKGMADGLINLILGKHKPSDYKDTQVTQWNNREMGESLNHILQQLT